VKNVEFEKDIIIYTHKLQSLNMSISISFQFINQFQLIVYSILINNLSKNEINSINFRRINIHSLIKKGLSEIYNFSSIDPINFIKSSKNMYFNSLNISLLISLIKKRKIKERQDFLTAYAYVYTHLTYKNYKNYSLFLSKKLNYSESYIKNLTKELFNKGYIIKNTQGIPGGLLSKKTISYINSQKFQQYL